MKAGTTLIRKFVRGPFAVTVTAYDDDDFSGSDFDSKTISDIENGDLVCFRVEAALQLLGHELATEHLGGCVYKSPSEFMDHIGIRDYERELSKKAGHDIRVGSYFTQMVRTVIKDGRREAVKLLRQLRDVRLRGMDDENAHCLGHRCGDGDCDCEHEHAGEVDCEHCRFGPYPNDAGQIDPRYPSTHQP